MAERIITARQVTNSAEAKKARHQGRQKEDRAGKRVRIQTTRIQLPDGKGLGIRTITTSTRRDEQTQH